MALPFPPASKDGWAEFLTLASTSSRGVGYLPPTGVSFGPPASNSLNGTSPRCSSNSAGVIRGRPYGNRCASPNSRSASNVISFLLPHGSSHLPVSTTARAGRDGRRGCARPPAAGSAIRGPPATAILRLTCSGSAPGSAACPPGPWCQTYQDCPAAPAPP